MFMSWFIACYFTIVFIIPPCVLFFIKFIMRLVQFILPENLSNNDEGKCL